MIFISVVSITDTRGSKERSRMRHFLVEMVRGEDKLNELKRIEDFKVAILICHWNTSRNDFAKFSFILQKLFNHESLLCLKENIYVYIYIHISADVVLHVASYYSFKRETVWNSSAQTRTFSIYITSWNIGYYFSGKSFLSYSHRKISDVYFTHWEV